MANTPYKHYTFKSTGETVIVPPVSVISLQNKFMRSNPPPSPPFTTVDYGDGPVKEINKNDPDWIASLQKHQGEIGLMVMEAAALRIAVKQILNDEKQAAVDEFREILGDTEELHSSDKVLWFQEVASGNDSELTELIQFASGMADPTSKGVDLEADNFRSAV